MNENLTVRNADIRDCAAVSKLLKESWQFAYAGLVDDEYLASIGDDHWVSFLQTGLSEGNIDCILVQKDGCVIGACVVRQSLIQQLPEDGEMVCLYLLPGYIGTGAGHILYIAAETLLIQKGCSRCILDVLEGNHRAIQFYKAHGFEQTETKTDITLGSQKLVCLMMRKAL